MTSMALHDRIRKLTYEDYVLIPEDGQRHEIIDGEHYVTAAPFIPHQDCSSGSPRAGGFVKAHRLGRFSRRAHRRPPLAYDIVQPDLLFISNERAVDRRTEERQGSAGPGHRDPLRGTRRPTRS